MILSISDVAELKKQIAERFRTQLHFHDACGGQYFSVDEMSDALREFLTAYFAEKRLTVRFSADGSGFSVGGMTLC